MKKPIVLCLLLSFSLSAQLDPLSQYFNRLLIPNLVTYDSISVSLDSGNAFNTLASSRQHYFTNGLIDTLSIYQNATAALAYKAEVFGRTTRLKGINLLGGGDSIDMLMYHLDVNGRDSAFSYHTYTGAGFEEDFEVGFIYNSIGDLSRINIYVPVFGKVGDWRLFYDAQQRIDSLYYVVSVSGSGPGYITYHYNAIQSTLLEEIHTHEDIAGFGEFDVVQKLLLKNNAQNETYEITNLSWDNNSQMLTLAGAYRYGVHSQSSIGLGELASHFIEVYPNPFEDQLRLKVQGDFQTYEIRSLNGKLVQQGILTDHLDLQHLPAGVYLLNLLGNSAQQSLRIVKR